MQTIYSIHSRLSLSYESPTDRAGVSIISQPANNNLKKKQNLFDSSSSIVVWSQTAKSWLFIQTFTLQIKQLLQVISHSSGEHKMIKALSFSTFWWDFLSWVISLSAQIKIYVLQKAKMLLLWAIYDVYPLESYKLPPKRQSACK